MSQENLEIVRSLIEAFRRRDSEIMEAFMAPEVEWDGSRFAEMIPDLAGVYHGIEGGRQFWRAWLSSWSDLVFEYELRDAGDDVIALIRDQRQWGKLSGIATEVPPYAWVYTIRDSRVVRACFYPDHASALKAVGLSE